MCFLKIKEIQKKWADTTVLDSISLDIQEGEFIALLGASGCGKSTLLRILSGLIPQTSGEIYIQGKEVSKLNPADRQMSMVFQTYALFPHLSVVENILFGLKARKISKTEQQNRLHSALELVSLQGYETKKPSELSGGQRQRVAVARAIVSQHPICLMDEPLSNLDAKLRGEMRSEIRALQKKLNLTVIYVTHDQIEAMSMADRVVLLNKGKIEQIGTPKELYYAPKTPYVASFIGNPAMNLFKRGERQIGIRPEHIQVINEGQEEQKAKILKVDYHGDSTLLLLDYQGSNLCVKLGGYQSFNEDDGIYLQWDDKDEYHF